MHALLNSVPPTLQQVTANPHLHLRLLDTHRKSGSASCGVTAPFSWFLVCKLSVCALRKSVSPVLCRFWQLFGGVNVDLLLAGLCHTQVCCTQSPCPCGRPLMTRTSAGDTQTQFCLSLCGVSGSWCTRGLSEPSESLWQVRDLNLNVISPLLPSCWHFSFAVGRGVSPQSHLRTMQCLPSCWGLSALGPGVSVPILYLPMEGVGD